MHSRARVLLVSLFLLGAPSAAMANEAQWKASCAKEDLAADARIAACTSFIAFQAGKPFDPVPMRDAFYSRALAYNKKAKSDFAIADLEASIRLGKRASSLVFRGRFYRGRKQYQLAQADVSAALQIDPNYADAKADQSALNMIRSRKEPEAAISIDQSWKNCTAPDAKTAAAARVDACAAAIASGLLPLQSLAVAYRDRGIAYWQNNLADQAVVDFSTSLRMVTSARTYVERASVYLTVGNDAMARSNIDSALRADAKYAEAFMVRGVLKYRQKDTAGAFADLDQAARLSPDNAEIFSTRGALRSLSKDYDAAIADYSRSLRINPADEIALVSRARLYTQERDYGRAVTDYNAAIALNPGSLNYNGRCWARALWNRDLDAALADCNTSLQLKPDDSNTLDSRALVYLRLGRFAEAMADASKAVALDSKLNGSRYVLGLAKLKAGDPTGMDTINAANAIDPETAKKYAGYGLKP